MKRYLWFTTVTRLGLLLLTLPLSHGYGQGCGRNPEQTLTDGAVLDITSLTSRRACEADELTGRKLYEKRQTRGHGSAMLVCEPLTGEAWLTGDNKSLGSGASFLLTRRWFGDDSTLGTLSAVAGIIIGDRYRNRPVRRAEGSPSSQPVVSSVVM